MSKPSDSGRGELTESPLARALVGGSVVASALFDSCPDGVLVVDPGEGRIVTANPAMCRMLGYGPEELAGREVRELHPREVWPRVAEEFAHLRLGKRHFAAGYPVVRKDGGVFHADISSCVSEFGGQTCLVGWFRDVTGRPGVEAQERDRIQRDLMVALAAAHRLGEGFERCLDAALRVTGLDSGGIYLWNPRTESLELQAHRGLSEGFVRRAARFGRETPQARAVLAGTPLCADRETIRRQMPHLELDEGLFSLAAIPIREEGRVVGCLNVASHSREQFPEATLLALQIVAASAAQAIVRLHAEEEARSKARSFRALVDTIDDLIVVAGLDGRILFGNVALQRKLGYSADEVTAKTVMDLHPPDRRAEAEGILGAMLRRERATCPLPLMRKDGGLLPVETQAWFGEWDGEACLFAACRDLSLEQEAQERFERMFRRNPLPMALNSLPDLRNLDVNDAWLETTGYSRDEALGRTPFDLGLFPAQDALDRALRDVRSTGVVRHVELAIRTKDGTTRDGLFWSEVQQIHGRPYLATAMVDITARKQVEEALRQRLELQEQLSSVAASVPGMICSFRLRPDGTACMPFATAAMGEIYGLRPEEVRDSFQPVYERIHGDDRGPLERGIAESARTMQPWRGVFRFQHPRKGEVWIEGHSVPRRESDGSILWHGYIQDISERRRAEEALRESESKYRIVAENTFDWEFWLGPDGRYLYTSRSCERITGHRPAEFVADPDLLARIIHPDDLPRFQAHRCAAVHAEAEPEQEFRIVRADGEVRWLGHVCQSVRDEDGVFLGVRGSNRDITERKLAEIRFRALIENAPDGVVLCSASGVLTYASPSACRLVGLDRGQLQQVDPAAWTHPEDLPAVLGDLEAVLRDPSVIRTRQYRFRNAGGDWIWVESTFTNRVGVPGLDAIIINFRNIHDRKQAEETLASEATRRRILVDGSRDGIVVLDREGKVFEANRRFAEMLGYSAEEVQQLHVWDWDRGWSRERVLAAIRDLGPEGAHFESRHQRKDGSWFDVELSNSAAELAGQRLVFCICHDVTERKRAEAQVARDALRTKFLLELHQRAPQMTDRELHDHILDRAVQLTASSAGFLLHSEEETDAVVRSVWELGAVPKDGPVAGGPADRDWGDLLGRPSPVIGNAGEPAEYRRGFVTLDGGVRRFAAVPVLQDGRVRTLLAVGNKPNDYDAGDVEQLQVVANELHKLTLQRAAQNRLRRSEQRFRHLVETTFDWVWEIDGSGRFTYASPRVFGILGYTPEEVIGKTPFDFMPPDEARRIEPVFREIVARREAFTGRENANVHRNGRTVEIETSGVPVLGDRGELLGYRGMDRDVTERRRLEQQVRQAAKLEAIGQLAGGVAHDFNNIIAAILMQLDLLQNRPALEEETRQGLKDVETEAGRAAALTRQLLMFSRRSVLDVRPLDLNEVVTHLLKMLGRLIGEQVRLGFEAHSGRLPAVSADAGLLEQVLVNLVVNARDAMPRGGRVTIGTGVEAFAEEDLPGNPDRKVGRFVSLTVTDTGVGMSRSVLERIFEPFYTTKETGKGTGLGLATAHGIVAQHKGWIEVESEVSRGTRFRVLLPALAGPVLAEAKAAPMPPIRRGHECILLVEDEPQLRRTIALSLRAIGYRVLEAGTGQEALGIWQTHGAEIDLMFTDMVMPEGMSGLELMERLRVDKPTLRVVISSGYSADILQVGVLQQTGVAYLAKPYRTRALADTIRACLDRAPAG